MTRINANEWKNLQKHADSLAESKPIRELFQDAQDSGESRFKQFSLAFDQLFIDFSKQQITGQTLNLLLELAESAELEQAIKQLFSGEIVNVTENRPALHSLLRMPEAELKALNDNSKGTQVLAELDKMAQLIEKITSGDWRGYSGKPIKSIVNLGVGGSDLGPLMLCYALDEWKQQYSNGLDIYFASTMDGGQVTNLFGRLNPETTLFVVVSKSFSTVDTMTNASLARSWLTRYHHRDAMVVRQHFIGVSASEEKMTAWGIEPANQLKLWDWVGGRFSLWSSVGFVVALKIGMKNFRSLLEGAHQMDLHFLSAEWRKNIPIILGLLGVWNSNFLKITTQAVLPYDSRLKYLPDYLAQLEMESNGKSVSVDGRPVDYDTCPIIWGGVGPDAQHAFYQLLHQGTRRVSSDFIVPLKHQGYSQKKDALMRVEPHLLTIANCLAQAGLLMQGAHGTNGQESSLSNHQVNHGNQPSTTFLVNELSPYSLGQLIAMYEHKVFVMAKIWGVNPFDQWGVEMGKKIANEVLGKLYQTKSTQSLGLDESTLGLIDYISQNLDIKE